MENKISSFLKFMLLTVVTFGIYPLYFTVTRTQEGIDLLREIKDNTKNKT